MNDQSAKADKGKLRLTLVPPEIIEAVAVVREYGDLKYSSPDNWKTVKKERYRDAAFRHYVAYLRDPYGMDGESNLPHLFHLACNVAFLCAIEIADGSIPDAQTALERMTIPEPLQAPGSHGNGNSEEMPTGEDKEPGKGAETAYLGITFKPGERMWEP